jgi:hypothetical protein
MTMPSFQHLTTPLRLFHGADSLGQLGRELDRAKSTRAVIFCGSTLAREGSPLSLVREAGIVHGHVFPFSPRGNTPAARMPQLDRGLIKRRAERFT